MKLKRMTKRMTNRRGVAVIVLVSGQIPTRSWRTTNLLGFALRFQGLLAGRKHVSWKSIYDRIVPRTPHGWYNLMPPEKVVIGLYFKNLLNLTVPSNPTGKHLLPDLV